MFANSSIYSNLPAVLNGPFEMNWPFVNDRPEVQKSKQPFFFLLFRHEFSTLKEAAVLTRHSLNAFDNKGTVWPRLLLIASFLQHLN